MQPDGDRAAAEVVGEAVVVVPAVLAVLVAVAVGADAVEWREVQVAGVGERRRCRSRRRGRRAATVSVRAVGELDGLVFDVRAFRFALSFVAAGLLRAGLCGGDAVDGEPAEVAQEALVVDAAQRGVVDDALRAGQEGSDAFEAVHGGGGFAAGFGDPVDVEDDAAVGVVGAGGDEHELGAPGGLAGAFEVQAGVVFGAARDGSRRWSCRRACRRVWRGRAV